jgi:hypothetical protein
MASARLIDARIWTLDSQRRHDLRDKRPNAVEDPRTDGEDSQAKRNSLCRGRMPREAAAGAGPRFSKDGCAASCAPRGVHGFPPYGGHEFACSHHIQNSIGGVSERCIPHDVELFATNLEPAPRHASAQESIESFGEAVDVVRDVIWNIYNK